MLTVTGNIYVLEVTEKSAKGGSYFNLEAVTKGPYQSDKKYYKVSIYVPEVNLDKAREKIIKGKFIQIRIGELEGKKYPETGVIFMQVTTKWHWIEFIKGLPEPEKQIETGEKNV